MIWAGSGRLMSVLFLFLLHTRLAHQLPPDEYGCYVLIESITLVLSLVILAGVPTVALRTLRAQWSSGNESGASETVKTSLGVVAGAAVVTGLGVSLFAFVVGNRALHGILWQWLPWIVGTAICTATLRLVSELARGYDMLGFSYLVGGQSGGFGVNALLLLSAITMGALSPFSLTTMMSVQVGIQLLTIGPALAIILCVGARNRSPAAAVTVLKGFRSVLRCSIPLLIQQLVLFGLPETDTMLLGSYSTAEDVALYGAARKLVFFAIVPLLLTSHGIQPFISEFHSRQDLHRLTILVRGMATIAGIPSLFIVFILLTMPELMLLWIFGETFVPAAESLRVLSLGAAVFVITGSCGLVLTMTGHERAAMWSSLTSGAVYLIAAPLLIERFGTLGAAIGATGLQFFTNVSGMLLVYYHEHIWTGMSFSKTIVLECIAMVFPPRIQRAMGPRS